ncbi:MAG: hypothetical protein H7255_09620 [Ramlibacter sp.]|nr:hypothetical protein [Ramlibacter sp.]
MSNATRNSIGSSFRSLAAFGAFCAAATVAASAWAAGLHEEGFILDAPVWQREVASVPSTDWPVDNWYRLTPTAKAIDVRVMKPSDAEGGDPDGTVYVRVPGAPLKQGLRATYRFSSQPLHPRVGHEYQLMLAKTGFSFTVESDGVGTQYNIVYGGQTHTYLLGLPAAATTIKAIADLDGDAMPDFLVGVGDGTFLLLSTQAQPGFNLPSAQLWALADDGC